MAHGRHVRDAAYYGVEIIIKILYVEQYIFRYQPLLLIAGVIMS